MEARMKCGACILCSCSFRRSACSEAWFTNFIPSILDLTSWDNFFFFVNFLLGLFPCCLGSEFAHLWWLCVYIELGWMRRMERSTCHCTRTRKYHKRNTTHGFWFRSDFLHPVVFGLLFIRVKPKRGRRFFFSERLSLFAFLRFGRPVATCGS